MPVSEAETKPVFYREHPAMFRARPVLYLAFVLLTAAFGLGLVLLAVWWVRTRLVTVVITGRSTRVERGFLAKHVAELRHWDVADVDLRQGRLQKLMNVGTVSITSVGPERRRLVLRGMLDPTAVRGLISQGRPPL
jgi:hypothetical protein